MNYFKPEDIKEYASKNPEGIAGMSEELAAMVNHFAKLIVKECAELCDINDKEQGNILKKHFGVDPECD
jgi:hypothetical protein